MLPALILVGRRRHDGGGLGLEELLVDRQMRCTRWALFVPLQGGEDFVIGADIDVGTVDGYVDGAIDEVRIYDRALSAMEIATLATP